MIRRLAPSRIAALAVGLLALGALAAGIVPPRKLPAPGVTGTSPPATGRVTPPPTPTPPVPGTGSAGKLRAPGFGGPPPPATHFGVVGDSNSSADNYTSKWLEQMVILSGDQDAVWHNYAKNGAAAILNPQAIDPMLSGQGQVAKAVLDGLDHLVIALGTNDVKYNQIGPQPVVDVLVELDQEMAANSPATTVWIALIPPVMPPWPDSPTVNALIDEVNLLIQQAFPSRVIDFNGIVDSTQPNQALFFQADGLHMAVLGRDARANEALQVIWP